MAELSADEKKRQEGIIGQLIEAGAPKITPSGNAFFPVNGTGSLAAHFTKFQTDALTQIRINGISPQDQVLLQQRTTSDPNLKAMLDATGATARPGKMTSGTPEQQEYVISSLMAAKMEQEKARLTSAYLRGAASNTSTSVTGNPGDTLNLVTGALGIDMGGFFGRIAGMVSQIPVVGDYLLGFGRSIGSGFEWLLSKIGIGDPNAQFVGPMTAVKEVRDAKRFGGGAAALMQAGVSGNLNDMVGELKGLAAGSGPAAPPAPPPKLESVRNAGEKVVEATGLEGPSGFKEALKTLNYDEAKFPDAAKQKAALAAGLDKGRADGKPLDAKDTYMVVMMPDSSLAIAVGGMDETGQNFQPREILTTNAEGKLVPAANAPSVEGVMLPTDRKPTLAYEVSKANPLERSFSMNANQLRASMNNVEGLPPSELNPLNIALSAPGGPIFKQEGKPDVSLADKPSMLAVINNKAVILTGSFNAQTNEFTPEFITSGEGAGVTTRKIDDGKPIPLKPTFDNAKTVSGQAVPMKDIAAKKGLSDKAQRIVDALNVKQPGATGINSSIATDPFNPMNLDPSMKFMIIELPGGDTALVGGREKDGKFTPVLEARLKPDGSLDMPVDATDTRPLTAEGKTAVDTTKRDKKLDMSAYANALNLDSHGLPSVVRKAAPAASR